MEINESEQIDKYLERAMNVVEYEGEMILNVVCVLGTAPIDLENWQEEL